MPLEHRRARPTEAAEKTATAAGGQRPQPLPPRVRRRERPFSGREVGVISRSQMRRGHCVRSDALLRGLLIIPRGLRDHAAEGRRPDPSPERVRAVGTVPGAVQSPRLAGRPPLSKWPRVSRVAGHSGRVAGGLAAPLKAVFWAKLGRGGLHRPKSDRF